jgi:hypothetical protein
MKPKPTMAAAFLALAISLTAASGRVQAQTRVVPTPAQVMRLDADLENSRVYLKVASSGRLGHAHGVAGRLESGWIRPGGGGELVFAMRTFITDTPDARRYVGLTAPVKPADQRKSTANMLGPDVLDVQRYPRATFKIDAVDPAAGQAVGAPGVYQLSGTFTLHGVSRPLTLQAKLEPTSDSAVSWLRGAFAIRQTQFGITPYSALGGMVGIEDRLDIWGEFVLRPSLAHANASDPKVTR